MNYIFYVNESAKFFSVSHNTLWVISLYFSIFFLSFISSNDDRSSNTDIDLNCHEGFLYSLGVRIEQSVIN